TDHSRPGPCCPGAVTTVARRVRCRKRTRGDTMPRLSVHPTVPGDPTTSPEKHDAGVGRSEDDYRQLPAPLLVDINALAALLTRSVPSLHRDDAAGRLPAALRLHGSKRWRYADIALWVELGCPPRTEFEILHRNHR